MQVASLRGVYDLASGMEERRTGADGCEDKIGAGWGSGGSL